MPIQAYRDISANATLSKNDGVIYADPAAGSITLTGTPTAGPPSAPDGSAFELVASAATDGAHTITFAPQAPHTGGFTLTSPGWHKVQLVGGAWRRLS